MVSVTGPQDCCWSGLPSQASLLFYPFQGSVFQALARVEAHAITSTADIECSIRQGSAQLKLADGEFPIGMTRSR